MEMDYNTDGHDMIFVVGCPRSGTTYLQRLLASLPGVKTGQETHIFGFFIRPLVKSWRDLVKFMEVDTRGGVGLPCYIDESKFKDLLRYFLFQLLKLITKGLKDDEIFIDKTPQNAFHVEMIKDLLPEARFIHMLRDPRDVVSSLLAANRSWGSEWAPGNARDCAILWRKHVKTFRTSIKHIPSTHYYELKYEELVKDPLKSISAICKFLNLHHSKEVLEKSIRENDLRNAHKTGGTKIPLGGLAAVNSDKQHVEEPEGFIRRGTSGGWQDELSLFDKINVWRVARHTMREVGYSWRYPW